MPAAQGSDVTQRNQLPPNRYPPCRSPMDVNSSSISAGFTSVGTSALGKASATSATQHETVCRTTLSNDEQSVSDFRRPHTFPWLVFAHFQGCLAFWAWACICDCNTYSDIVVTQLLCFLLYFDRSFVGNMDMNSSRYFSPSFWTL